MNSEEGTYVDLSNLTISDSETVSNPEQREAESETWDDPIDDKSRLDSDSDSNWQSEFVDRPNEVLSTETIAQNMSFSTKKVNSTNELPARITRILLNHFKWDKRKLLERSHEDDQDKLVAEARVVNPSQKLKSDTSQASVTRRETEECIICFSTLPNSDMTGLECGHYICKKCWCIYLAIKMRHEGVGQISCAAHGWDEASSDQEDDSIDDVINSDSDSDSKWQSEFVDCPNEVLSAENIAQHMVDCTNEVNSVVGLPASTTRILLNHFKWDKRKLVERFYEDDQDTLFAEARIVNPFQKPKSDTTQSSVTCGETEECIICFSTLPNSDMTGLQCGHSFCKECWCDYLTTKICDEGVGRIACAANGCDILMDDASVMRLVNDPEVRHKYLVLITNSFVDCNRLLRWCPSPSCSNVIKVQYVESIQRVRCNCGQVCCFSCGENWHEPIKCALLKQWLEISQEDSLNLRWIKTHAKECPQCGTYIEKVEGCLHMHCARESCQAEFCWHCLELYKTNHVCNTFKAQKETNSQWANKKYLFYCDRYMNHKESLQLEHKLYATIERKIQEIKSHATGWIDVQFLKKAVDVLWECRQTLMYTYVFAFYLEENNQSQIFEVNQGDLEIATERLSEYLRDIMTKDHGDITIEVQDKSRYCRSRRNLLLQHVNEGYEKGWWQLNQLP